MPLSPTPWWESTLPFQKIRHKALDSALLFGCNRLIRVAKLFQQFTSLFRSSEPSRSSDTVVGNETKFDTSADHTITLGFESTVSDAPTELDLKYS